MNPLHWKREHQIALLGAAVVGAAIGIFAGSRQIEPSANEYWLWLALCGVAGGSDGRNGRLYPPIVPQPNVELGHGIGRLDLDTSATWGA
jgi:hypothetical protein